MGQIRDNRDAHNRPLTEDRRAYSSAVAQLALKDDLLDWAIVRSYSPSDLLTTAIIRRKPAKTMPVRRWQRNMFRSETAIERAIAKILSPDSEVDDDQRTRVFLSSVHSDPGFLSFEDAEMLVELICRPDGDQS